MCFSGHPNYDDREFRRYFPPREQSRPTGDNTFTGLSTRSVPEHVLISEIPAIGSQDELWKMEKIPHKRTAQDGGSRVQGAKPYVTQWKPGWLSTEEGRLGKSARLGKTSARERERGSEAK